MEKIVVAYRSKTGFTKKYAQMIAEEIGCELADFNRMTVENMSKYDTVVYGSRLFAGTVEGLKKAKEMYRKSGAKRFIVFATGATPNTEKEIIEEVWKNNLSSEEQNEIPHFYMQAGLNYENMPLSDKILMKGLAYSMKKKKDKTDKEKEFEKAIACSFDSSSREFIIPLVRMLGH